MIRETERCWILEWKKMLMRIPNRHGITQKNALVEELEKVGDHQTLSLHHRVGGILDDIGGDEHLSRYDERRLGFLIFSMQVLDMIFEKCFRVD